jgi:hypothetical protein
LLAVHTNTRLKNYSHPPFCEWRIYNREQDREKKSEKGVRPGLLTKFLTEDTKLSTFRPAVSTSNSPLCRSSLPYSPNPIAAQHNVVLQHRITLRLVMEWAALCFRSQHRDIRYSSRPNKDTISRAAGMDPKMPRLWRRHRKEKYVFYCTRKIHSQKIQDEKATKKNR